MFLQLHLMGAQGVAQTRRRLNSMRTMEFTTLAKLNNMFSKTMYMNCPAATQRSCMMMRIILFVWQTKLSLNVNKIQNKILISLQLSTWSRNTCYTYRWAGACSTPRGREQMEYSSSTWLVCGTSFVRNLANALMEREQAGFFIEIHSSDATWLQYSQYLI